MSIFTETVDFIWKGFQDVLLNLGTSLPTVILGLLVGVFFIIIGWIVGNFAKKILIHVLQFAKLDDWAKSHNLREAVGGIHLSVLAGSFLKWYVILLFLQQAVESVKLNSIQVFLKALVFFIPVLLFASAVFVLGLLLGRFVKNKIIATNHKHKKSMGSIVELVIIYLSLILALERIGLNVQILKDAFLIAFSAFVIVLALVFGVSLGLAFKKEAKDLVNTLKKEMRDLQ